MGLSFKTLVNVSMRVISVILYFLVYDKIASADVIRDLEDLRDRCLYYSIGHAPNDPKSKTIRSGLYAQSPFSKPATEIDIAASGFSLAALPSAVDNGLISKNDAENIAKTASQRIRVMVKNSAAASTQQEYEIYGFKGMLYHFYIWSEDDREFHAKSDVEVSSIDTALLMFGLLVCGNYFKGDVLKDYRIAKDLISWKEWLDTSTPGHVNQFRMSYEKGAFTEDWWDWRSEETMLICLFAAMSDSTLNIKELWKAWRKIIVTYNSPAPDSKSFTCYATWNGDPFTVFYGLHFFKFRTDFNGINWFKDSKTSYRGHVEFFKKERGFLDSMTLACTNDHLDDYFCGSENLKPIAEPKYYQVTPYVDKFFCPIYSLAGGLEYFSRNPSENEIAIEISELVHKDGFFEWTGWPPDSIIANDAEHKTYNNRIIGQNIASIAISIDNYLTNRIRNIVMQDSDLLRIYNIVFPVNISPISIPLLLD